MVKPSYSKLRYAVSYDKVFYSLKTSEFNGKNGFSGFYISRFTCISLQMSITSENAVLVQKSQS